MDLPISSLEEEVVPREVLQHELLDADLLTYPSTWAETFCLSAVEAGAAGLRLLLTNLGALPEVCGDRAIYVPFHDNKNVLSKRFAEQMNETLEHIKKSDDSMFRAEQSLHFNSTFSWDKRKKEWIDLFNLLEARG